MSGSLYDTNTLLAAMTNSKPEEVYQDLVDVGVDDPISHPAHYNAGAIETLEVIFAMGYGEGFCLGCVIKYVARWKMKGGLADLKKAREYLDRLIQYLEESPNGKV